MSTPSPGARVAPAPPVRRAVWASLPALTLGGAVLTAAVGAVLLAVAALSGFRAAVLPVLPALLAVSLVGSPLVGACYATLQAQCCDVTAGLEVRTADWPRYLWLAWRDGAVGFGLAGLAAAAFLAGLAWWSAGAAPASVAVVVAGLVLGLAVPVLVLLTPLRLLHPGLTRGSAALLALHLTARRPVPVLGALALVVLAVVGAEQFSSSVLALLPAPLALTSTLAARRLLAAQ